MKKTFYSWLLQFKTENTPLGDFARDAKIDKDFPSHATSYNYINKYLESKKACNEALNIFNEAFNQYQKTFEK